MSAEIAARWFSLPSAIGLLPIPVSCAVSYSILHWIVRRPDVLRTRYNWVVYAALTLICLMAALGLAYSMYPDIIIGRVIITS